MEREENMSLFIKTEQGWRPLWISHAPCSNSNDLQGVYRPEDIEVVKVKVRSRLERFFAANACGSMLEKQHYFRGNDFIDTPIYGAFGEKL